MSVCLSVCMYVCLSVSLRLQRQHSNISSKHNHNKPTESRDGNLVEDFHRNVGSWPGVGHFRYEFPLTLFALHTHRNHLDSRKRRKGDMGRKTDRQKQTDCQRETHTQKQRQTDGQRHADRQTENTHKDRQI